jgi:hypothetical protein
MALTGHLSDLSLSELIEFFCNQRKSGRLKVLYPKGAGYFYLQSGSVVDARIGLLHGIDAVYYALTLPNAEFEFSVDAEPVNRTINQPWTQVVLEGLRRLDEGITPGMAFPPGYVAEPDELESTSSSAVDPSEAHRSFAPSFLNLVGKDTITKRKPLFIGAIAVAVVGSVAAIGVPAGWYKHSKPAVVAADTATIATPTPQNTPTAVPEPTSTVAAAEPTPNAEDTAAQQLKRQREKEKKAREKAAEGALAGTSANPVETGKPGAKKVVVTVTYDDSGRVVQASGGDATALRIARQKRFPPGKPGSATITIPIN